MGQHPPDCVSSSFIAPIHWIMYPLGFFFGLNNDLVAVGKFPGKYSGKSTVIYEVIRIIDSTPLFLLRHLNRLKKSVDHSNLRFPNTLDMERSIHALIKQNQISDNNIRVDLVYNLGSQAKPEVLIYFIPSKYPSVTETESGVDVKTISASRTNPSIKSENSKLREMADEAIKTSGCYEVLLINEEGYVTEGSRSNVFFVQKDVIITPPIQSVLGGITREVVFELCSNLKITVDEKMIPDKDILDFDAAFLTGTSPGVLPISTINEKRFKVDNPLIKKLLSGYNEFVRSDIRTYCWEEKH